MERERAFKTEKKGNELEEKIKMGNWSREGLIYLYFKL